MRVPSTRFLRLLPGILQLGALMLYCISVIAQAPPERSWRGGIPWLHSASTTPATTCSVQPSEVVVGDPVTATVIASNVNPKHTLNYVWYPSNGGGKVIGRDATAQITTTDAVPGSYTVTVYVTDLKNKGKDKKNNEVSCSASFTIKPVPPKNPPTLSLRQLGQPAGRWNRELVGQLHQS
jgi:hypothetical protein